MAAASSTGAILIFMSLTQQIPLSGRMLFLIFDFIANISIFLCVIYSTILAKLSTVCHHLNDLK